MESRILIYAPTGKDARLIAQVLHRSKVETYICTRASEVEAELRNGVGALLLVDEALGVTLLKSLTQFLNDQPTWSDLPILVMSQRGPDSPEMRATHVQLGNVTLLERPLHGVTLVSAATSALRARQRQYAMREIDRRKDEFLAMLAHELRNPLAPVSAASDLLKLSNLNPEKIRQTSEIISRQVRHMTGLIDDLLDVSRVSRGLVTLDEEILDARQIAASAVEQVRPLIDSRRHQLTLRTSPQQTLIKGDQKRLIQILSNVLNNAAKYTPEGGDITLAMDVLPDTLVFTITDNGIGISSNVIGNIFDMFAQAERTSDRTQGGLGIGLALVRNLVHLHGGTVSVTSEGIGKGSVFTIVLPRIIQNHLAAAAASSVMHCGVKDIDVLLVDDNIDAASMLGMFLETAGCKVIVVHTAAAALKVASDRPLDACLLDIGLPDMDGNELARQMRKVQNTKNALLVAITGYGQDLDREKSAAAGFNYHLVKPVDIDELMNVLSDVT